MMTTPHFSDKTVSRLRSSVLLCLLSGMSFIGCGNPPAPQIKEIVTYSEDSSSTQAYSYTSDDELKRVVYSSSWGDTEDRLDFSYRDGKVSKLKFYDNVSQYSRTNAADTTSLKFSYSKDLVTGLKLSSTEDPEIQIKGEIDYNSDDTLADFDLEVLGARNDDYERVAYSFDYTSDSLFDKVRVKTGSLRETIGFEYNSDELISEIRHRSKSGNIREHEFSYNEDGQLAEYESRNKDCELSYNEDGLVKEVDCTDSGGSHTTYEISYYRDESVEGMTPRIPGIGFGDYFSLDGKSLTPENFAEPMSIFTLLDW